MPGSEELDIGIAHPELNAEPMLLGAYNIKQKLDQLNGNLKGLIELNNDFRNRAHQMTPEERKNSRLRIKELKSSIVQELNTLVATAELHQLESKKLVTQVEVNDRADHEKIVKMTQILIALKESVEKLRAELEKFEEPPLGYGQFVRIADKDEAVIFVDGRRKRVNIYSKVDQTQLKPGKWVVLGPGFTIMEIDEKVEDVGEEAKVAALLENGLVRVSTRLDEIRDVILAENLRDQKMREGDVLVVSGNFAIAKLPKSKDIEDLALTEVPNVLYEQIGGLRNQIEEIKDAVESPFIYAEIFARYKRNAPKGVLFYGPPGCGKTLIAKAVAKSLSDRLAKQYGRDIKGYFISVKGPEILNKYVGESERKIRDIFNKAREKSEENCPVIIFVDEADSIFRTRGAGISSDVEITIVPQFLAELDGMEELKNVIVILASNRQDLIDPAVLRPGRVDIKIRIDRPDKIGAREIFEIYITSDLPINAKYLDPKHQQFNKQYGRFNGDAGLTIKEHIIPEIVRRLWATEEEPYIYHGLDNVEIKADNRIMMVQTETSKFTLYLKDLVSGAMIKSIVDRAKQVAIKREIDSGEGGLMIRDFCIGVELEMKQNEELPNTRDDVQRWLEIQGRRERVLRADPFERRKKDKLRPVENISTGQYL